jgi:hypothetical protein
MSTLLSSISGQFGKMVVLGTLFPVLIVSILDLALVEPLLPFALDVQEKLKKVGINETWFVVELTFVVLVITGLLYNLNIPIIRLYEGYPWKESWLGKLFAWRKKRRFREAIPLRAAIRYLRAELTKRDPNSQQAKSLQAHQTALARFINSELPDREDLVLPTRLGNVIRCFERYSAVAYGIDAIVLWPRLISKIDTAFASTIDDAKTSFDFMLNFSFLSALTSVGIIVIGLSSRTPLTMASAVPWIGRAALFFILAFMFYLFAIERAKAWGGQVRAAFDLYRFALLSVLGYQQQPQTFFEEQALWQRISVQLLYADSRERPIPYKAVPTRVVASPVGIRLEVKRKLSPIAVNGNIEVELIVENKDNRTVDAVTLVETLPEGYRCVLQSVFTSAGTLRVSNLNPLELVLDPIGPGRNVTVKYSTKPATA